MGYCIKFPSVQSLISADEEDELVKIQVPNGETVAAIDELESGKGVSSNNIEELMAIVADRAKSRSDSTAPRDRAASRS
jgi:ABC-type microcin C transport system duplicated ATPase subunit YejF